MYQHRFIFQYGPVDYRGRIGAGFVIGQNFFPRAGGEIFIPQISALTVLTICAGVFVDLVMNTYQVIRRGVRHCDLACIRNGFETGRIDDRDQIGFTADATLFAGNNVIYSIGLGTDNDIDFITGNIGRFGALRYGRAVAEFSKRVKRFHQPR